MNNGDEYRFDLWLYNEMQIRGWTIYDMAEKTGLNHETIKYLMKGKRNPTLRTVALILKAFGKHFEIVDD